MRTIPIQKLQSFLLLLILAASLGSLVLQMKLRDPVPSLPTADTAEFVKVLRMLDERQAELEASARTMREISAEMAAAASAVTRTETKPNHDSEAQPSPSSAMTAALIASDEAGMQLSQLPRIQPNYAAVDDLVRNWRQRRNLLLYQDVGAIVAHFGFPDEASIGDQCLLWTYYPSQSLDKGPRCIIMKISRNRVVEIVGMAR